MPVETPHLDKIASPVDLNGLTPETLAKIADDAVSYTHLTLPTKA